MPLLSAKHPDAANQLLSQVLHTPKLSDGRKAWGKDITGKDTLGGTATSTISFLVSLPFKKKITMSGSVADNTVISKHIRQHKAPPSLHVPATTPVATTTPTLVVGRVFIVGAFSPSVAVANQIPDR